MAKCKVSEAVAEGYVKIYVKFDEDSKGYQTFSVIDDFGKDVTINQIKPMITPEGHRPEDYSLIFVKGDQKIDVDETKSLVEYFKYITENYELHFQKKEPQQ